MEFGNASWGFRELPLEEQLKITSSMGLDLLELGIANAPKDLPLTVRQEELEAVKEMFDRYGIRLWYGATGNDFTGEDDGDVEKIAKVTQICARLGIRYLRIFAGFSPVEEVVGRRWDHMISRIKKADRYAQAQGVCLVIETHGGVKIREDGAEHYNSVSTQPETLKALLEQLPDTVRLNFDPANLWAVGIKRPEVIWEMCRNRVAMIHLKDFVRLPSGRLRAAACGEGGMDLKPLLRAIADYEGAVLFEYENPQDVKEGSLRCYRYVSDLMKGKLTE